MSVVLFDIDGTLLRGAGPQHKNALIDGIHKVTGFTTTLDGVPTQGMLDRDLVALMLNGRLEDEALVERWNDIAEECQAAYLANRVQDLRPYVCPNVNETLHSLRQRGTVLGLVTGNLSAIGWRKMELAGLRDYFSFGAFSQNGFTRAGLARHAVEQARAQHGIDDGTQISLVGDHPNDVEAARHNGYQSIAVATGVSTREELAAANPDILIANLAELDLARV